jgi:alpha-glucosidase
MQCAAFTPFLRGHTNVGTIRQEPWAFGKEAETIVRHYIELRYQLLPYLYSLFAESTRSSAPIMRPLFWHHADDLNAVDTGDQFLVGRDLMVAPILKQGAVVRSVYLPEGNWYDFRSSEPAEGRQFILAHAPLSLLPIFLRGGAVIPFRDVQQFVGEKPMTELTLRHWVGGMSSLELYDDDGKSNRCEEGHFAKRTVFASSSREVGQLRVSEQIGDFQSPVRRWRVLIHGQPNKPRMTLNGRPVRCEEDGESGGWRIELAAGREGFELMWD